LLVGLFYQNVCQNTGDLETVKTVCDTDTCFSWEILMKRISVTPPNIKVENYIYKISFINE